MRRRTITAGLTEDEAEAWLLLDRAAAKYLALPRLHPAELQEMTALIHDMQTRIMSRGSYRAYREAYEAEQQASR